jgi:hypothetical protein
MSIRPADFRTFATSSAGGAAKSDPAEVDLRSFGPMSIQGYRDGGSVGLFGNLNRSVQAKLVFDQGINSPTRGEIFVSTKVWNQPDWSERQPLSIGQAVQLWEVLRDSSFGEGDEYQTDLFNRFKDGLQFQLPL